MLPILRRQPIRPISPFGRFRRIAFSTLYGPAAPVYDAFTHRLFLGEWARWQQAALPFLPTSGCVVELGAGTGALARIGGVGARRWIAVEPSRAMLRAARRQPGGDTPIFVRATAQALPLAAGAADAVVATFPGPFLFAPTTVAEIARILRPGGRLVVVLDGRMAPDGWRRRLRSTALRRFYGQSTDAARTDPASAPATAGFTTDFQTVPTRHGAATLFLATRIHDPTEG